ncbi:hypothetical protein V6N11_081681 [Hibiscus sabdariffa]|uniref:Uncharacterized protein n=1 Tax=Hibiscus sabdariffa TaxID=183260 RepID=A0ABR1ZL24_9ROSI
MDASHTPICLCRSFSSSIMTIVESIGSSFGRLKFPKGCGSSLWCNVLFDPSFVERVDLLLHCKSFVEESEKDDSEDVPNGVCEGPVTQENPLFWNGEADRGVADEDVGLVHREVSSSEQLRELGFMETQRALPPVPGLQGSSAESCSCAAICRYVDALTERLGEG